MQPNAPKRDFETMNIFDLVLIIDIVLRVQVIVGLWVLSVIGNCCNFLTLFYIGNVIIKILLDLPLALYCV